MKITKETKIGFDIDEVLIPLVETCLLYYNKDYDDNVTFESLTEYDMSNKLKITVNDFFEKYATEKYVKNIKPYPNVIEYVNLCKNANTQIYFVTSGHPNTMKWRNKLLKKYFEWYEDKNLIMCQNKQLLKLDYLFDDNPCNLTGGDYEGIVVARPWNVDCIEFKKISNLGDNI